MNRRKKSKKNKQKVKLLPELIIGLVGGIGSNLDLLSKEITLNFDQHKYKTTPIRISKYFNVIKSKSRNTLKLKSNQNEFDQMINKIEFGNTLRKLTNFKDIKNKTTYENGILSWIAISAVNYYREQNNKDSTYNGHVYIINQLKTLEEFKTLRKVYGRSFILISAFEEKDRRRLNLINNIKSQSDIKNKIDKLIERDDDEKIKYGQNVSGLFPESHLFVDVGNIDDMKRQIKRFTNILFGYQFHTPTIDESRMFLAKGAASRSADLSRQVGAVITNMDGDIISMGCNEVPKFGGGLFWENDIPDLRDFRYGEDPNKIILSKQIEKSIHQLSDLIEATNNKSSEENNTSIEERFKDLKSVYMKLRREKKKELVNLMLGFFKDALPYTEIGQLLEYSRCLHAEMAAICDAARRGISLKESNMYCTTYPCHLCAKHILAVGIQRVIYIDPYPKSKAMKLFEHSISDSGNNSNNDKLVFEPFKGIAPRRFLHIFLRREDDRKSKEGKVIEWDEKNQELMILFRNRTPASYYLRELGYIKKLKRLFKSKNISIVKNNDFQEEHKVLATTFRNIGSDPDIKKILSVSKIKSWIAKEIKY